MSEKSRTVSKGVGKRAHRAAKIKVDVFKSLQKIASNRQLDEISVDELCAEAGISKVTFFKYFPQKEDVLFYYLRIWSFDRALELGNSPRQGLRGVYYLFERMGETYERYPGLVMSMLGALAGQKRPSVPISLKLPERQLLSTGRLGLKELDVLSIPQLMEKFLLEAIMDHELRNVGNTRDLSLLFLSLFYGTMLARHNRSMESIQSDFRRNIEFVLGGLKVRKNP